MLISYSLELLCIRAMRSLAWDQHVLLPNYASLYLFNESSMRHVGSLQAKKQAISDLLRLLEEDSTQVSENFDEVQMHCKLSIISV